MATPVPAKASMERSFRPSPQAMRFSRVSPIFSSKAPRLTSLATPSGTASMKNGLEGYRSICPSNRFFPSAQTSSRRAGSSVMSILQMG